MFIVYLIIVLSAVPNHPWFGAQVGGLTMIKYLGFLGLGYAFLQLLQRRTTPPILATWPARFFLLLFLWALMSYLFVSTRNEVNNGAFMLYLTFMSIFLVTVITIDRPARVENALLALVGALTLASLYSLREWQTSGFSAYRPGWVAGDANFFSAAALLTIPLAYRLAPLANSFLRRWYFRACLLLTVVAFVVSGSRGAFAGLCVVFVLLFLRSKRKMRVLIAAALLTPMLVLVPVSPVRRIMEPGYGDRSSEQSHYALWEFGVQVASDHPVIGIGLGEFKSMTETKNVLKNASAMAHNTYIELAAETGVIGCFIYLAILISAIAVLQRVRKQALSQGHSYLQAASAGLQEGLAGFAVAAFFFSAEYEKPLWITIFIVCVFPAIAQQMFANVPQKAPAFQTADSLNTRQLMPVNVADKLAQGLDAADRAEGRQID